MQNTDTLETDRSTIPTRSTRWNSNEWNKKINFNIAHLPFRLPFSHSAAISTDDTECVRYTLWEVQEGFP